MTQKPSSADLERIRRVILASVEDLFQESQFDDDAGHVQILDRDDACVWIGLFLLNNEGDPISDKPAAIWTIEVHEEKGATP